MGFKYEMEQRLNLTNAFGGTFVFFSKAQTNAKNPKEPPSQRTTSLHTMNETTTTDERAACNRRITSAEPLAEILYQQCFKKFH